jgi:hypothetical protein
MAQNEQILKVIETEIQHSSQLALRLHDDQIQSVAQLESSIRNVNADIETNIADAQMKDQRMYLQRCYRCNNR